ncbi:MAG: fatty acid desaturase family protein [Moraxellaceae bacterium]|nr:fatty acid desaturase family protein [Moraxellaceae bacterium]
MAVDHISSEAVFAQSATTKQRVTDVLSREEIRALTQRSDLMGAWAVLMTWGGVVVIFTLMAWVSQFAWWLALPGIVLGMVFLAGRQLSLSILVHDAAHGTLFKTKWLNSRLTDWLCARPLWNDLAKYRAYHFIHHTRTGTADDPDLILRDGYPTSPRSLTRKFARDLSGVIGIKFLIGRVLMDLGLMEWTVTGEVKWLPRQSWGYHLKHLVREAMPMVITNIVLFMMLSAVGHAWLYLCWVGVHLTFFMVLMRIRSMAEHATCARNINMFENTRTVRAGWLARALVAPIGVNYHMEHHILASCPWFKLSKAHQLLKTRHVIPEPPSYWQVIQIMGSGQKT